MTFLTTTEVAEIMNLSARSIRRKILKGVLPGFRFGRVLRIRREDLAQLIENASVVQRAENGINITE